MLQLGALHRLIKGWDSEVIKDAGLAHMESGGHKEL